MNPVDNLLSHIDQSIYFELKEAVELGRWKSGKAVSESQRGLALQGMIAYENRHFPAEKRTAYIYKPEHDACGHSHQEEQPVKIKNTKQEKA